VKYTEFLYPLNGPGGGGAGGKPPMVVGVGSEVLLVLLMLLLEREVVLVMLLLLQLVVVGRPLLKLVEDIVVLRLELLVGSEVVLVVTSTSVLELLELGGVPIVIDVVGRMQESPPRLTVVFGAKAYIVVGTYIVVVARAHSAELSAAEITPTSKVWASAQA
jgi:hypothetical protein